MGDKNNCSVCSWPNNFEPFAGPLEMSSILLICLFIASRQRGSAGFWGPTGRLVAFWPAEGAFGGSRGPRASSWHVIDRGVDQFLLQRAGRFLRAFLAGSDAVCGLARAGPPGPPDLAGRRHSNRWQIKPAKCAAIPRRTA